jgi:hypothetical protein
LGIAASTELGTSVRVYEDGQTTVISPHLEARTVFNKEQDTLTVAVASDIVTSSSSDVVTNSTGSMSDERNEISMSMSHQVADGTLGFAYIRSEEHDWTSNGYSLSATKDFFEKNTVVGISLAVGDDNIRSSINPLFNEYFNSNTYGLSLTQILNKFSAIQFLYDLRVEHGFLEGSYRSARVQSGNSISLLSEKVPETRGRNTFAVKYNYYLDGRKLALNNTFRVYTDTWAVNSFTYKLVATKKHTGNFFVSYGFRIYSQTSANFYQDIYTDNPIFRTGNKTLADLSSLQFEIRPAWHLGKRRELYLKFEYFTQDFQNHTAIGDPTDLNDDYLLKLAAYVLGIGYTQIF